MPLRALSHRVDGLLGDLEQLGHLRQRQNLVRHRPALMESMGKDARRCQQAPEKVAWRRRLSIQDLLPLCHPLGGEWPARTSTCSDTCRPTS
jgi:hypothetical protein